MSRITHEQKLDVFAAQTAEQSLQAALDAQVEILKNVRCEYCT